MELLIDGVRYKLWTPKDEAALEDIIKEHAKDIFGEDSIYFDIKPTLRSQAGIGSKPDGYVIAFEDTPRWYIVEVELSSHPLYEHIVPQMTKFSRAMDNLSTQKQMVDATYRELKSDSLKQTLVQTKIGAREIHEFLSDLMSSRPTLVIVIEKKTEVLEEVCTSLPLKTKVVEFRTFEREGVGLAVHAHLFEAIWKPILVKEPAAAKVTEGELQDTIRVEHTITDNDLTWSRVKLQKDERYLFPKPGKNNKFLLKLEGKPWIECYVGPGWKLRGGREATDWFRQEKPKPGDVLVFEVIEPWKHYRMTLERA